MDSIEFSGLLPPGHGRQYRVKDVGRGVRGVGLWERELREWRRESKGVGVGS